MHAHNCGILGSIRSICYACDQGTECQIMCEEITMSENVSEMCPSCWKLIALRCSYLSYVDLAVQRV